MLTKYDAYASRPGMHQRRRMMVERKSLGGVVGKRKADRKLSLTDNLCAVPDMFPFSTFSIPGRWCCWLCRRCNTVWGDLDDFFYDGEWWSIVTMTRRIVPNLNCKPRPNQLQKKCKQEHLGSARYLSEKLNILDPFAYSSIQYVSPKRPCNLAPSWAY